MSSAGMRAKPGEGSLFERSSRKVVINTCFGGFSLSHPAVMAYAERKGMALIPHADEIAVKVYGPMTDAASYRGPIHYYKVDPAIYHALSEEIRNDPERDYRELNEKDWYFSGRDMPRDDEDLVAVVEALGDKAAGRYAKLAVVEIPADAEWEISEYDGLEHVAEAHRTWR